MPNFSLTVVIPTFNRSEMLKRCVSSALNDVLGTPNLEARVSVIVADDASNVPDALRTLDDLEREIPEKLLKVIRLSGNSGGAAAPRNAALDCVTSDFVYFVDSDDYLGVGAIPKIVQLLDENNPDYLCPSTVTEGNRSGGGDINGRYSERSLLQSLSSLVIRRIFRVALIREMGLRFEEYLRSGQDVLFAFQFLINANKFGRAGDHDYYHLTEHALEGEDGHLSRKGEADGFPHYLRVSYGIFILEKGLIALSAAPLSRAVQGEIAAKILLPRVFDALKLPRRLGYVQNRDRQRGLFRELKNVLSSDLVSSDIRGHLAPNHLMLFESIRLGDLEGVIAYSKL